MSDVEEVVDPVSDSGIISRSAGPSALTTGVDLDLSMGTLGPGKWIIVARTGFAMSTATSSSRVSTIVVGGVSEAVASDIGNVTSFSGTSVPQSTAIVSLSEDTGIVFRFNAIFSDGSVFAVAAMTATRIL